MSEEATPARGGHTALRRSMRFTDLIIYGLVFLGPAAAVSIFGPLYARSNGAVPTVYLVATVAMSFTAMSYARMSRVVPRAGSVFAYASAGIGPRVGFVAGWMVMLDYLLIPSVAYLFTGIAMHAFVPVVPTWAWTAIAVLLTTGLNLAGVRVAVRAAAVVVAAEVLALAMVLVGGIVVLVNQGPERGWLTPLTAVGDFSITAIFAAVSVAILSYLGFDAIATFAEEHVGDSRTIGRATVTCLVIAGLLFAAQTYVGALLAPVSPDTLAAHPEQQGEAYYHLVQVRIAGWLSDVLSLAKAVGAAFAAMVGQAAAARILMDMGRQSWMPRTLARVTTRTRVPMIGILGTAVANVAIAVWAAVRTGGLSALSSIVNVGAISAFVLLHAAVVGYFYFGRAREQRRLARDVLPPVIGAGILLVVLALASHLALIVGAVWLVVGLIILWIRQRRSVRGEEDSEEGRATSG